jgi:hypothetical protein
LLTSSLLPPLALWATWLVWVGLLTGTGLLVRAAVVRTHELTGEALFASFWLGTGAVTFFLILLHFIVPIATSATVAVALAGMAGLVLHTRPLLRGLARAGRLRVYGALAGLAVLGVWSGLHGLQEVVAFDTHMYVVPVLEWIKAYRLPPGLANLHERFGFNTGTLPFAAMLEGGPWIDGSTYLVNGIFVTAVLLRIVGSVSGWPGVSRGDRARRFYDVLMITPIVAMIGAPPQFRSLEADVPATLAILSALSLMIGHVFNDRAARPDSLVASGVALTLGAMFKLSAAAAAVPLWVVLLTVCIRVPGQRRRLVATLVGTCAALAAVWMVRGVVLSGHPLYPSQAVSIPVDWRVPREQAEASAAWVLYFAKTHYSPTLYNTVDGAIVCGSLSWIRPWFRELLTSSFWWQIALPLAIAAGLAGLAMVRSAVREALRSVGPLASGLILGGTIWFAVSPRPDLGIAIAWSLAGVTAAAIGAGTVSLANGPEGRPLSAWAPLLTALLLSLLPIAGTVVHEARSARGEAVRPLRAVLVAVLLPEPAAETWLVPTRWEYPTIRYTTAAGLELLRPGFHRCSRAPVPCTSHPAVNLRLRVPGDLASGFAVDGEWVPERYPNPASDFLSVWRQARSGGVCADGLRTSHHRATLQFERPFTES